MGFWELLLIAVGLSMDAFAVAVCAGLCMSKSGIKKALVVGLYFGCFQAGMPLIGYFAATLFADMIAAYDHWVAFGLLCFIGGKMIADSLKKESCPDEGCPAGGPGDDVVRPEGPGIMEPCEDGQPLKPSRMIPLALATSIDALAVGISFAFLKVSIVPAVSLIGAVTLVMSMAGVKIGNVFGTKFKSKAQIAGGIILALIGLRILLSHLIGI